MIDLGLTPTESENADGDTAVVETMSDKKNREFLSRELVKYLWDIRKTPGAFENFDIYFVSVSTDKPSDVDKRAISDIAKPQYDKQRMTDDFLSCYNDLVLK